MDQNLWQLWQEAALVKNNQDTPASRQMPIPPIEKPYPPEAELIVLPEPELLDDHQVSFLELVELRSTIREYSSKPLTMKELSYLLWCTQGVKMVLPANGTMRTVPSAGARHALETYLFIEGVEKVPVGLYRFLPLEHALLPVKLGMEVKEELASGFNQLTMFQNSAVTFVWASTLERMEYLYGHRAWQYLYLDAGHVCQNLYLSAYTIQTGVCALGSFNDVELNQALGLDGKDEFAVYAAHIGKIK